MSGYYGLYLPQLDIKKKNNSSRSEVAVEAILLYLVIVENTNVARSVFFISQSFLTDIEYNFSLILFFRVIKTLA